MKPQPFVSTCYLLIIVLMLTGCYGCWRKPELQTVNPTKYLETQENQPAEIWELIRIKGDVAGYRHTVIERMTEEGETVYKVSQEDVISANRLGEQSTGYIETVVLQKRDGTFLFGNNTILFGTNSVESISGQPMVTIFQPDKNSGKMKRTAGTWAVNSETGEDEPNIDPSEKTMSWKPETLGPFGKQFSLWNKPLVPGETRTIEYFDLMLEQMGTVELTAGKVEPLLYNNIEINLLPIAETTRIGEFTITSQLWMDTNGNIVRTILTESFPMEIALSTKEKVKSAFENAGNVNLNLYALVRVQGAIPQPRTTQKVEFRLHRISRNGQNAPTSSPGFATLFPTTAFQTVKVVDGNTLDVTVTASSPEALNALYSSVVPPAPKEATVPDDLQRNEWIQSDTGSIIKLADAATSNTFSLWDAAVDLEHFVSQQMQTNKKYSFASAAEVAETLQGDSAGYAVLLAAIARVKNIPSRVVVGLVYTNTNTTEGVLVPHFWTELYIDGHWHPFDATQGRGGADASRIVLARSNLADESLPALAAKTLPLLGQMYVTIGGAGD